MESEGERDAVAGYSFGIGALTNCFHPLINLEIVTSRMDSAGLHRSRDPGAGAFTPYHNRRSYAYKNIPAGYGSLSKDRFFSLFDCVLVWRFFRGTLLNFFSPCFSTPLNYE
jgi:hypothetical protein